MSALELAESALDHIEPLGEQDRFRIRNEMQVRVAGELLGPHAEDENQIMFKWVASLKGTSLSKKFQQIIDAHPEFIDQYGDTNEQHAYDQDSVVLKIEDLLKQDPIIAEILNGVHELAPKDYTKV